MKKLKKKIKNNTISCDKCDFEIEKEVELCHVNPCEMWKINFDNEDELKEHNEVYHIKSPQKPIINIPLQ